MAAASTLASINGSHGRRKGLLGQNREMVIDNTIRQQFYQSDRVKQFHRQLLLTETLNERKLQIEQNRRIKNAADEEARLLSAEIRHAELEAMEKERQKAKQRDMDKKAYADELKQQMWEMEQRRMQKKLERQREIQECDQIQKQYEREMMMLKQKQRQKEMYVKNCYVEDLMNKSNNRKREEKQEEMEEEERRRFVFEKDQWTKISNEKQSERFSRRDRCSQVLGEKLAMQECEKSRKYEAMNARSLAKAVAQQEAKFINEQNRKKQMNLDMTNSIAAHREYKRKEQQLMATEERWNSQEMLKANKEADRTYRENQRLVAKRIREERSMMDNVLHLQIGQKQVQEKLRKQEEMEFDLKNLELLAEEDLQFQRYARLVIDAAEGANRNTIPLRKTKTSRKGTGLGTVPGRLRANYLVPGATYTQLPEYVSSTANDINRLYRTPEDQLTQRRLNFIW